MKTKQDIEEKRLLALHRERQSLLRRRPEKIKLEHPIQRGWMRCYFLTEEACGRSDAATLEAILKEINVIKYHWKRSFAPTRRNRRAQILQFEQPLQRIKLWRRRRKDFPQEWKRYFSVERVFQSRVWEHSWRFRWPQLFELRTVARMVHELPVCDPEADSRLSEIEAVMAHPKRSSRLLKLLGNRRWPGGRDRQRILGRLAQKRVRAALAGDLEAEKTAWMCRLLCLHISGQASRSHFSKQNGTSTGQACRGSLLTRSCRPHAAWGACPRRSAIFPNDPVV